MATTASTAANTSPRPSPLRRPARGRPPRLQRLRRRASEAHSSGFCGFALALTVVGPATVDGFVGTAVDAGATALKSAMPS
ncbi:hypothetical protein [Streptomyces sp. NBC_01198]|uniref:hypothetical protein n=1 Tax=Streptomyces sp. NBC_01198 TaxID=2903769 RepID=UPI002E13331F|nr:hypothetical protein OG702_26355 [Streptomyces sp. NBC_01198]